MGQKLVISGRIDDIIERLKAIQRVEGNVRIDELKPAVYREDQEIADNMRSYWANLQCGAD